ncbi:MAG: GNAT family N-acetyltransferase [Scytolyngbya sp. HA4215-MV1]|jgi:putative acetyltransferase|nr:GNAT family N-acetyltransferase [Scytolyngbya sp. HA4215-MV1]
MEIRYHNFLIRSWQPRDRAAAAELIRSVLSAYGLKFEPKGADLDVLAVEAFYTERGGEFWVVEHEGLVVGTAAYYPIARGENAVEIRKMYLFPGYRGLGLGRFLLETLEQVIADRGFQQIWLETASVLVEAIQLYERNHYQTSTGVETARCDRVYVKQLTLPLAPSAL